MILLRSSAAITVCRSGAAFKIAPALAAGNTVILKPCPETALEDYIWADAAEAGLPEGVLNIVMGDRDAGAPTTRTSGLAGVVYSADEDHALDVARQIRSGTVGLNYYLLDIGSPYGGYQESGLGRELGGEIGIEGYPQYKSIYASARYPQDAR